MESFAEFAPWVIGGGILLLMVGGWLLRQHLDTKRSVAFGEAAVAMGLSPISETDVLPVDDPSLFELTAHGHTQEYTNVVTGRRGGFDLKLFDYSYVVGHGKNRSVYRQTVAFVRYDRLSLPPFTVQPENMFHKIGSLFGAQDIDFDEYPEFSKRFLLRGPDEDDVRTLFQHRVIQFFEANLGCSVEGIGDALLFYYANRRIKPEDLQKMVEQVTQLVSSLRG